MVLIVVLFVFLIVVVIMYEVVDDYDYGSVCVY